MLPGTILSDGLVKLDRDLDDVAASIPPERIGDPRDIGHAVRFPASDEAGYITGQTLAVDGGVTLIE